MKISFLLHVGQKWATDLYPNTSKQLQNADALGSPILRSSWQGRCQHITFGGLEPRSWRAREREPISGSGAPQRESRGQSPRWGSGTKPPWSWKFRSIWSSGGGAKFDNNDRFVFAFHIEKFSVSDYSIGTDTSDKLSRIHSKQGLSRKMWDGWTSCILYQSIQSINWSPKLM